MKKKPVIIIGFFMAILLFSSFNVVGINQSTIKEAKNTSNQESYNFGYVSVYFGAVPFNQVELKGGFFVNYIKVTNAKVCGWHGLKINGQVVAEIGETVTLEIPLFTIGIAFMVPGGPHLSRPSVHIHGFGRDISVTH